MALALLWGYNTLSDWHNVVRDFGAVGDGVADDTSAIQAAVDWTSATTRGTIYFPRGTYKVTAPIRLPLVFSIVLIGDGEGSIITGDVDGFIFDRYDPTFQDHFSLTTTVEKLKIVNTFDTPNSYTGALRLGTTTLTAVRDCTLSGVYGLVHNENDLTVWRSRLVSGAWDDPGDLAALQAISGTLSITINGTVYSGTVNFSGVSTFIGAAALMQTALTDGAGNDLSYEVAFLEPNFYIMSPTPPTSSTPTMSYATGTAAAGLKLTSGTASAKTEVSGGSCGHVANLDGSWTGANTTNCASSNRGGELRDRWLNFQLHHRSFIRQRSVRSKLWGRLCC